ncbi:MAG: alginate O-acetyltransferase AlgF [Saccharospirillaceae bacterium]|nr:alginate O-acetyltransferase AlgF [Pseudomonadales bacterium]NRB77713.1 alginate O-acetyltransferase AlgF [Saccharospirillaceae bacterium]
MPILFNRKYLLHALLNAPMLFVPFLSVANEKALYDVVPKGASYVRFINVSENMMTLKFLNKKFELQPNCEFSNYVMVTKNKHKVIVNGKKYNFIIEPNKSFSVVINEDKYFDGIVEVIHDAFVTQRNKAVLSVYNFDPHETVSLKIESNGQVIFNSIKSMQHHQIEVNPVKLSFLLELNRKNVLLENVKLVSENNSNIVICQSNEGYKVSNSRVMTKF